MSTSPTQRTLKYLKDQGLTTGIVERYISGFQKEDDKWIPGRRIDLFNIIDIIAIDDAQTIGVQSCGQDFSGHHKKLTEEKEQEVRDWLAGGTRELWLIGWRKLKLRRGGKAKRWRPRTRKYYLTTTDFLDWEDPEAPN